MARRLAALGHPGVAASTFHAAALRQLRHFWPRVHGVDLPGDPRVEGADPGATGRRPAGRLPLPRGPRPCRRDRMGEGAPDRPGRRTRSGHRDDRDAPCRTISWRGSIDATNGQGASRPDRLRGHARADRRAHRRGRGGRGRGPRPVSLVLRRRVPGHQPAPGRAPRRVAGRTRRPGRRRRRGPDDLHLHRRHGDYLIGFAARFPAARSSTSRRNYRSTPEVLGARQPSPRGRPRRRRRAGAGGCAKAPKRLVPSRGRGLRRRSAGSVGGSGARGDHGRGAGSGPRGHAARRDGGPRSDKCPVSAIETVLGVAGIPFHVRGERFFSRPGGPACDAGGGRARTGRGRSASRSSTDWPPRSSGTWSPARRVPTARRAANVTARW